MRESIIPAAALDQHIAVLGKTGSGKTFASKAAIVEPLLAAGRLVGIVDPTDAWWGLRSSRDGKGAGFQVLVLGGDHGDLPLPANGGAAVARLLIEQGVSLVACTKGLTVGERTRWFIDFAGTVNRINRAPLNLVLDEAHNFAPQGKVPDPDTGKMLHAANALASEGRSKGIRLTMITQRPQKLHKDTLTCAETLIAMRVLAPHDRLAVEDWIKGCGDMAAGREVLNSLASLQKGEGWIWYPEGGFLKRYQFPRITTFDSSATPTHGGTIETPKGAAELDLTEIRKAMAEAVAEAEANDPKRLRVRISELERELKKGHAAGATPAALAAEHSRGVTDGWGAAIDAFKPIVERSRAIATDLKGHVDGMTISLAAWMQHASHPTRMPDVRQSSYTRPAPAPQRAPAAQSADVTGPQQRILDALAWLESVRIMRAAKVQLALLSDQSPKSSGYHNNLGALRSAGFIEYPTGGEVALTAAGRTAAQAPHQPPTTQDLHAMVRTRLPAPQWRILEVLIGYFPESISKPALAAESGQSPTSSGYHNNLGALRSLGFIDYPETGRVAALPVLFLE